MNEESYGEILSDLVDTMAQFEDRTDIFRRCQISRNHFYNVTNPSRESSSGKPYHCPTEYGVTLTRESKNYRWLKTVAKDCGCLVITPEELGKIKDSRPEETLKLFMSILGMVKTSP